MAVIEVDDIIDKVIKEVMNDEKSLEQSYTISCEATIFFYSFSLFPF